MSEENSQNLHYVSVLMRLSIATLMFTAALLKVPHGIDGTVGYYMSLFQNSLLPAFMVKAHASVIMIVEFILGFWLLSGIKIRAAWIVTSLVLVSLAIGMIFAGKYDVASDNYVYVVISALGLFTSSYDRWAKR